MNNVSEVIHGHVASHILEDDGTFPNNQKCPVLVYKGALHLHPDDRAESIQELFKKNNWTNAWQAGIYDYHHYHSTCHEVLGVFCGVADVQLGGPEGICVELVRGDVLVIPAGVSHKSVKASDDFLCVGAYAEGRNYDMNYGKTEEREKALSNIAAVTLPVSDPVFGADGPLLECWMR